MKVETHFESGQELAGHQTVQQSTPSHKVTPASLAWFGGSQGSSCASVDPDMWDLQGEGSLGTCCFIYLFTCFLASERERGWKATRSEASRWILAKRRRSRSELTNFLA